MNESKLPWHVQVILARYDAGHYLAPHELNDGAISKKRVWVL
jgi:hypothetical protein